MTNILIVEDQPYNMRLLVQIVEDLDAKIQIFQAFNGEEALKELANHFADLILMDINLPEISGLELLKLIRRKKEYLKIPVIAVTAYATNQDARFIKEVFDDYLAKPVDEELVIEKLLKWLNR